MADVIEIVYKFFSYVMFGFTMEIIFVALSNVTDGSIKGRDKYLEGKTYLWMIPIYGILLTFLYEPIMNNIASYGILTRFAVYGMIITTCEGITGFIYDKILGFCPWDYSMSKWKVHPRGYTKLSLIPVWGLAGLIIEQYSGLIQYLASFVSTYFN